MSPVVWPGLVARSEGPLHHVANGILDRLFDDDQSIRPAD